MEYELGKNIMSIKFYGYKVCGTCRKGQKFLEENNIPYENIPIRDQPPTIAELKQVLEKGCDGDLRKLFNRSGKDYRALNMKDKLPKLSNEEAFEILHKNGNLVKRPFVCGDVNTVAFDEEKWKELFL